MPLSEALEALREMTSREMVRRAPCNEEEGASQAGSLNEPGRPSLCDATATKECMICLDAPREVRFSCGHACVCLSCHGDLRGKALRKRAEANDVNLTAREREMAAEQAVVRCPACRMVVEEDAVADVGSQVATAPTFVLPARTPAIRTEAAPQPAAAMPRDVPTHVPTVARGRAGRGGRGRGLASRGGASAQRQI